MLVNITAATDKKAEATLATIKDRELITMLQKASLDEINAHVDKNIKNAETIKPILKEMLAVIAYLLNK
jgi:pyruvate formate-lyase activating enzyme-like uncharacterized protein